MKYHVIQTGMNSFFQNSTGSSNSIEINFQSTVLFVPFQNPHLESMMDKVLSHPLIEVDA